MSMSNLGWGNVTLAQPYWLLLILLIPLFLYIRKKWSKTHTTISWSSTAAIRQAPKPLKVRLFWLEPLLYSIAILGFAVAMARPQIVNKDQYVDTEGIDIVIALDISGSMLAEDLKPNRLDAAKAAATNFINARVGDRIGLVVFSGESFTQCPITIDKNILINQLNKVQSGFLMQGTSIGDGMVTAADRLNESKGKSKVIILLTDGEETGNGVFTAITALDIINSLGVKVYTIGVGTIGEALTPVMTPTGVVKQMQPVRIDEPTLQQIAKETGGQYFRATDNNSLEEIYASIDQLEKTKAQVNVIVRYEELFKPFLLVALCAIVFAFVLSKTVFRSININ